MLFALINIFLIIQEKNNGLFYLKFLEALSAQEP